MMRLRYRRCRSTREFRCESPRLTNAGVFPVRRPEAGARPVDWRAFPVKKALSPFHIGGAKSGAHERSAPSRALPRRLLTQRPNTCFGPFPLETFQLVCHGVRKRMAMICFAHHAHHARRAHVASPSTPAGGDRRCRRDALGSCRRAATGGATASAIETGLGSGKNAWSKALRAFALGNAGCGIV